MTTMMIVVVNLSFNGWFAICYPLSASVFQRLCIFGLYGAIQMLLLLLLLSF